MILKSRGRKRRNESRKNEKKQSKRRKKMKKNNLAKYLRNILFLRFTIRITLIN